MKIFYIRTYFCVLLLFVVQILNAAAQSDTLNAHIQSAAPAASMNTALLLPQGGVVQPLSSGAPVISYGSARTFAANQQIDWIPTNSGDAATFSVTVEQSLLSGYYNPLNTVSAPNGTLYITNSGYHSILKRTAAGVQTVFAGGNSTAYGYVNGTGTTARFRHPSFLAVDASGNIFVADQQNHRIRKITPSGVVTVFAGSGSIGSANGTGTAASFNYPMGLAFDGSGNLYVADAYNHRIRKITPTGVVTTYAGSGTAGLLDGTLLAARFNYPIGLSFDGNGDLYVADRSNFAIRKISGNNVTTLAGNGTSGNVDGLGPAARFQANNLVVEKGNIYFVDQTYSGLKHISPSGYVTTISTSGQFSGPFGISRTSDNKYHITENASNRLKKLTIQAAYSISPALPNGLTFDRSTGKISGKLSAVTASQSYTVTARNASGTATSTLTFSVGGSPGGSGIGSSNRNYILESVPRQPYKVIEGLLGKPVDSVNRNIQYFDGLGRPNQIIQWQGSPNNRTDIVQYIEYDGYGREVRKYLPYAENSGSMGNNDMSYKSGAKLSQLTYYAEMGSWDPHIKKTAQPYAEIVFENSPLKRVLEQGAPGMAWQPEAIRTVQEGRTVVTAYSTNLGEDIRFWKINTNNIGAIGTDFYPEATLYKTVVKDENWLNISNDSESPTKGGTTEEYRDFEDQIVLKRVWESESKKLDTYYIYDDFGELRYVVPPGYSATTVTDGSTDFNELVYAYRYDEYRRLIEKKIPGKGWEYIVYNKNDQSILTQDALQRLSSRWSYTKYDAFGRVASTGIYTNLNPATRQQVQVWADLKVPQWEDRMGTANYTSKSFPDTLGSLQELTVSYYDDYTFANAGALPEQGVTKSLKTKTLLTGMKVSKDDGTAALLTVNYYDDRARLIQSVSQNHLNGTDRITNEYSFVGELIRSTRVHIAKGVTTTMVTKNEYDHVGRLLATKHKINGQDTVILAKNEYNEIGQLKKKSVGGDKNDANYHTAVDYAYNERGWATGATSPQFTYQLNYNVNSAGIVLAGAQYNGNIAQQLWGHGAATNSTFSYSYDRLNRLINGTSTGTTVMIEALTYDDMGNIRTLARNTGNTTATTSTTYTYNNSNQSNRLKSLTGAISTVADYTYDANGNATKDRTGMTIRYNHLNLPDSVYNASVRVGYLYDAMGTKLRKYSNQSGNRDYVSGIEYNGNNIELIHMDEGVAYRNTSNNTYTYHYNLTDHLGNVRSIVYRNPTTSAVEVLQKDDYYPFGKQRVVAAGNNKYLYNGKEIQGELGGQYDYGARFYDADIGRWNVVDPLAEDYMHWSPYNYAMNSPLVYIDPDGMAAEGYFTRYVDPNGKTILNTDDGRNDVVMVPWNRMDEFLNNAYWNDKSVTTGIDSRGWNNHWRRELGIHISESTLNNAGHYLLETEASRAAQVKYFITGNASDFRDFVGKRVSASWSDPVTVATYMMAGVNGALALPRQLSASEIRAIRGLEKQIKEHQAKLKDYRSNPDAFDNKGMLSKVSPEARSKIVESRIRSLENQINTFKKDIKNIKSGNKNVLHK